MKVHELKTWCEPFDAVWRGLKNYEIRKDDRDYQVGDGLILRECAVTEDKVINAVITYLTRGPAWGIPEGLVVLSLGQKSLSIYHGMR